MNAESILRLDRIWFRYPLGNDGPPLFRDLNLELYSKQTVALLGSSGVGKTTLCRLLSGLISPSSGRVIFKGGGLIGPSSEITISFQNYPFFPWLSVEENVLFGVRQNQKLGKTTVEHAIWLLRKVGLESVRNKYPRELSGGMQQRLSIARSLAVHPEILILDEPFSALDAATKEGLIDLIQQLRQRTNFTPIIVLHNLEDAYAIADRAVILRGRPARITADICVKDHTFAGFKAYVINAMRDVELGQLKADAFGNLVSAIDGLQE